MPPESKLDKGETSQVMNRTTLTGTQIYSEPSPFNSFRQPFQDAQNHANYGIVEMKREKNHVRPIVKSTDFCIVTA